MAELSGLQVFKYLPAAKKLPEGNCKKCGFPTCMAYALKLAKNQTEIELCPYIDEELKNMFSQSMKKPQKTVALGTHHSIIIGDENVLFRHDKTFVNKTAIAIVLDTDKKGWEKKLSRIVDFEITRVNETFKVDVIYLKGKPLPADTMAKLQKSHAVVTEEDFKTLPITEVKDETVAKTVKTLTKIRKKAVLEKDENYSNPTMVYFKSVLRHPELGSGSHPNTQTGKIPHQVRDDKYKLLELMSKASFYLCKYANMLIFEDFDEALISTLMTLRQNIYTDPQKPLQVESKVYEFNNADENSLVFLTTNFALTYFAVANEIEAMNKPAYLVVTPSDGMSVLTAWSAEKFTAQIAAKTVKSAKLDEKIKNKKLIIPGLLAHMKEEIKEALPEFEILVGPNEAYLLSDFVKSLN